MELTGLISEVATKMFALHPNSVETLLGIIDKASTSTFDQLKLVVSDRVSVFRSSCTKDLLKVSVV